MKNKAIGVSLLFKEDNTKVISGILKSVILESNKTSFQEDIKSKAQEISKFYKFDYLGINDVFSVSGKIKQGEVLGRTTYYDVNLLKDAKSLTSEKFSFEPASEPKVFNCTLIYFCDSADGNFALSITTVVHSPSDSVRSNALLLANDMKFIESIKRNSIEMIQSLKFVGLADIGEVDLKFDTVQSFYSDFEDEDSIKQDLISDKEFSEKLNEIFNQK